MRRTALLLTNNLRAVVKALILILIQAYSSVNLFTVILLGTFCYKLIYVALEILLELLRKNFREVNKFLERPQQPLIIDEEVLYALQLALSSDDEVSKQIGFLLNSASGDNKCHDLQGEQINHVFVLPSFVAATALPPPLLIHFFPDLIAIRVVRN